MFKKILMALCFLQMATPVWASDITNPFYLPTKNQLGAITSAAFDKSQVKVPVLNNNRKSYHKAIFEELQYGLTDTLALIGGLGNTFDKVKSIGDKDSDKAYQYLVGMGWNILTGPVHFQVNARYNQTKYVKSVETEVKTGYQLKKYLPYISVGEIMVLDNKRSSKKNVYNAKVGLYQGEYEKWALDTGIRWIHSELGEQQGYNAEVETSYYLTPQTALSLYGSYLLYGETKYNGNLYDKSVGVRFRWFLNQ